VITEERWNGAERGLNDIADSTDSDSTLVLEGQEDASQNGVGSWFTLVMGSVRAVTCKIHLSQTLIAN